MVLGTDAALLCRVAKWCEAKDHIGLRGEASRLLSALIRHSRRPVSYFLFLSKPSPNGNIQRCEFVSKFCQSVILHSAVARLPVRRR